MPRAPARPPGRASMSAREPSAAGRHRPQVQGQSIGWMGRPTEVPAYHPGPPAKGEVLGRLLTPEEVQIPAGSKYEAMQRHAFALAAKIPKVLYQQPCYCYCDRAMGHKSLHSCYEGQH